MYTYVFAITTVGNTCFRRAVADRLEDFKQCQQVKDRQGMASVVQSIVDKVHTAGGRFIDQNWKGIVSGSKSGARMPLLRSCKW